MIETAVVIANWNGKGFLKDCFDSLLAQTFQNFKIIFVDNGSSDGSADFVEKEYLKNGFSGRLEIVKHEENTGFAKGYNTGISSALQDGAIKFVIILNNDTKLDRAFIEELINCAKRKKDAGSLQPKVLNFYEPKKIDCVGIALKKDGTAHNRGYGRLDKGQYDQEEDIFGANGTASLFTRSALESVRLAPGEFFDDLHFAYYEDVDLAWRIRSAGFKAYTCPNAVIRHVHSATTGKFSLFKAYYLHRNYFFVIFKNYPTGIMIKTLAWRLLEYFRLVFSIFKKGKKETEFITGLGKGKVALAILKAWGSVVANGLKILRKRKVIQNKRKMSTGEVKSWLAKYSVN